MIHGHYCQKVQAWKKRGRLERLFWAFPEIIGFEMKSNPISENRVLQWAFCKEEQHCLWPYPCPMDYPQ